MSFNPLVGVMGKKRHGKDTFASRLVDVHGFTRVAFADPLREAVYRLNPLVRVELDETRPLDEAAGFGIGGGVFRLRYLVDNAGWDATKSTREGRRLLQEYGVAIRETVDPEAWVRAAWRSVHAAPGPVVITDVRFPNEVAAVRRAGGFLVWVDNPRVPDSGDTHVSEVSVGPKDANLVVANDGTLDELFARVDVIAGILSA